MQRSGKELLIASRQFAEEDRLKSWWYFWSSLILLGFLIFVASSPYFPLLANVSASVLAAFALVRAFVIYHDFFHGAILRDSRLAFWVMYLFGLLILSPPRCWKHSHDHHHKHNSDEFGNELGAFPVMTTQQYDQASFARRFSYRMIRSPATILFGYVTSFLLNKTVKHLIEDPIKNYACGLSLILHFGLAIFVGMYSIQALLLGMVVPVFLGSAIGTYLFYVQHNFPEMKRRSGEDWDYVYASLNSSSHLQLSPLMNWFTGNIGYHHVHHLNAKIPFYRLPEAMANMQELQSPGQTSLSIRDVIHCLQLKLWDPDLKRLLSFREAQFVSRSR